jgi:hypothetical protein
MKHVDGISRKATLSAASKLCFDESTAAGARRALD